MTFIIWAFGGGQPNRLSIAVWRLPRPAVREGCVLIDAKRNACRNWSWTIRKWHGVPGFRAKSGKILIVDFWALSEVGN